MVVVGLAVTPTGASVLASNLLLMQQVHNQAKFRPTHLPLCIQLIVMISVE